MPEAKPQFLKGRGDSLTKKGRKHLEAETTSWAHMSNAMALILRTAE